MSSHERQPLLGKEPEASKLYPLPQELTKRDKYLTIAAVWLGVFLGALDGTVCATLITSISSEFDSSNQAGWLGTSYLLATATVTPLYGKLCDISGRRAANLTALAFFTGGTIICGVATSMNMLIAGRLLAGCGGGGLMSTSSIIASDLIAPQHRGVVQGAVNLFFGLGAGLGGPIGGLLSDTLGWRWAFLMQLPILALCGILVATFVRYRLPGQSTTTRDKLKRIDYAGFVTLVIWVGGLLLGLSYKTNDQQPWSSPRVYVSLALAALSLALFVYAEAYIAIEPVMPMRLLRQRSPLFINLVNFLCSWVAFSVLYFYPSFFEVVKGTTAGGAGAHLVPNSIALSVGSLGAGFIIRSTGRYWRLTLLSALLPVVALTLMTLMRPDWPEAVLWIVIMPVGAGNGSIITAVLIALIAAVDRTDVATATGVSYLFHTGQVIGVAASASLMQAVLSNELSKRFTGPGSAELIESIRHTSTVIKTLPHDQRVLAIDSYKVALRAVFGMSLGAACLTVLCTLPIHEFKLAATIAEADELDRQRAQSQRPTPTASGRATPAEAP